MLRWINLCLDCRDADELADFYCALFGWEVTASDGHGWLQVNDPAGGVGLNIQASVWYEPPVWPERPGHQTKMMHFEILVDDLDAAIGHAAAAGGRESPWQPEDRDPKGIRVMLDPAGHPFCLFTAGE